ncbi:hypothetical protein UlMin_041091 [Ulmus minor]
MGTKVHSKSFLPAYHSMRDLNDDSNSCSWPLYYGDNNLTNGQYYNGFLQRVAPDAYPGYDKDTLKQKMLEHEATFKDQVYELHRLYRIQKDMMDEVKRKEIHNSRRPIDTSSSASPLASQITSEDSRKWHNRGFPIVNSVCGRPSISGIEGIHSPLSSIKGNSPLSGPFPSQNGGSSRDLEVLESRPTKVRRKMFDLQLPADEYIDTEEREQINDNQVSAVSSSYPSENCKIAPESQVKLFFGDGGNNACKGESLRSDVCLRSTNGLADLNEPIQLEETKETNTSSYIDLEAHNSCNGKIQNPDLSAKSNLQLLGLPKEISLSSYGNSNSTHYSLHLQNNGNGTARFPHVLEAGLRESNLHSVSQGLQSDKLLLSSQPTQVSANKVDEPAFYLMDKSKGDLWREKTVCGVEISGRSHDATSNKYLGSFVASHVPGPYTIAPSSELAKSWSHSWEKPSSCLSQKSISVQTPAGLNSSALLSKSSQASVQSDWIYGDRSYFVSSKSNLPFGTELPHTGLSSSATLSKSSQASVQRDGIFGDKWYFNSDAKSNPPFGTELSYRNGFHQGSSSGSKFIPSISGDYLSSSNENNGAPGLLISDGLAKYNKGINCTDMKSAKDVNLNVAISDCSSNQEIPQHLEIFGGEQKHENHLAVFPWLRAKPACKSEAASAEGISSNKSEMLKDSNQFFTQNMKSISSSNDVQAGITETCGSLSNKKLLEMPHVSKNESSSLTSPVSLVHPSESKSVNNRKRVLDMNLPCYATDPNEGEILDLEKGPDAEHAKVRHHIDLNSCLSDDETSLKPSAPISSVRITAEIDLEAPFVPETEDDVYPGEASVVKNNEAPVASPKHKAEVPKDELMTVAAEAIVAISSFGWHNHVDDSCNQSEIPSKESSLTDPLVWFVEIVSLCGDDPESKFHSTSKDKDGEDNEGYSSDGIDHFESMTLKLTETKEEDYMPTPLVPEILKLEETGTTLLSNRPRKAQGRRGRQRRDFQRDILPGLTSLSRHEVTEDLQTFGGLMRAMGHSWNGLTRRNSTRNGCGRGRRRSVVSPSPPVTTTPPCTPLVQQLSNIEMGLEDRSLTGWGKTTRRPRRQRCPAGNPPSIPLT